MTSPAPAVDNPRGLPDIRFADIYDVVVLFAATTLLAVQAHDLYLGRPYLWDLAALLCANGALAIFGFTVALRRKYPILLACFFFDYVFFALAPLQQIAARFDPVFTHEPVLYTSIGLCLIYTAIGIVALVLRARPLAVPPPSVRSRPNVFRRPIYPLALFLVTAFVTLALLALYGPATLLSTRDAVRGGILQYVDRATYSLVTGYGNSLAFIGSVIGILAARAGKDTRWMVAFIVLLVLAELVNNPIVTARFKAAALLAFAMLVFFGWNNTRLMSLFLVVGTFFSPVFNLFRSEEVIGLARKSAGFDTFFVQIDYDAFAMTNHVVLYTLQNGYSYGYNILSAMLFFVPRALWPSKAEVVATLVWPQVRYYRDVWTDNLSAPVMAEGYYAFGLIGVVLLTSAVFAAFVLLERRAAVAQPYAPARLMVCLSPMLAVILLRGAFTVGFGEFCGNFAALATALYLVQVKLTLRPGPGGDASRPVPPSS